MIYSIVLPIQFPYFNLELRSHISSSSLPDPCHTPFQMGDTPLYWATRYGYSEVVQYLSEQGANVNHQNKV